jgi:cellulose synthase/poly-beta-1,6-N-acetylglucosamine synthase-like glycosyltransferase
MVGGPNLCPPEAPAQEQVFALVLSSWALGPSRARYAPVGRMRETSEKELILCNLAARRDALLDLGGFNEALYPNEENALMDELQKRGGKLLYDPGFVVFRRPRASLKAFVRMLLTYGRGRAEQFRVHPTPGSALNFVPPLFCVYLVGLAALPWVGPLLLWPLAIYFLAVLAQAAALMRRPPVVPCSPGSGPGNCSAAGPGAGKRALRAILAVPLIVLTHVLYGIGFWRGLFTRLRPPGRPLPAPIVLEDVAP